MNGASPLFTCPHCSGVLTRSEHNLSCASCQKAYPIHDGIPSFVRNADAFYGEYYRSQRGLDWARGHRAFTNPLLRILQDLRIRISIVGKRQRFFERALSGKSSLRILDLGCGGGHEFLVRYGAVTGIDLEMAPLVSARILYAQTAQADIGALPFSNDEFDAIVSLDVIGHIPAKNKETLFGEMYRVLKPGGIIIHAIETDSSNWLYRFAHHDPELFRKSFIEEIGGHFGLEMPRTVLARIERCGFIPVRIEKIWGLIWPTEEYIYRFDNGYKAQSRRIRLIVWLCKIINKNILIHAIANVLLGIPDYLIEKFMPIDHACGILVQYKKPARSNNS
ncbi:MAG: methyltransferase domain-containing protein [Candidatus Omnitrophota bacterium]